MAQGLADDTWFVKPRLVMRFLLVVVFPILLAMPGIQQRIAQAEAEQDAEDGLEHVKSELALHLVQQALWAVHSFPSIQKTAAIACADILAVGATPPKNLKTVAELGCDGLYPQNMWAEINRAFKTRVLSEPASVYLPVASTAPRGYDWEDVYFNDPHVIFADMYRNETMWKTHICPDPQAVVTFWQEQVLAGSPRLQHNAIMEVPSWKELFLPLTFFGDGAPVVGVGKSWGKTLDSWHFKSSVVTGPTKEVALLILALFNALLVDGVRVPHGGTMKLALLASIFELLIYVDRSLICW